MLMGHTAILDQALDALPDLFPGPGGVAGIVKDGAPLAMRAWGHSDRATHRPMTPDTRMPICSISKQFTCGVLLSAVSDPSDLDGDVAALLPNFTGPLPSVADLAHNQSGLRDYWALTILHGAKAEQTFTRNDALPVFARMKTGHFAPGSQYSYSNGNFRLLSEMIEAKTGRDLEDLYREIIWGPAGMDNAVLTADSRYPADQVVGYEGSDATGFFPAHNGIYWIGDAGISASLTDMMAYEAWIDATRDDPTGLYNRLSAPQVFQDGAPAAYGFGLAHLDIAGRKVTGHAGALRGFRAFRLHCAAERLSVVVMFNHEPDFFGAAASLFKAALGFQDPANAPMPQDWAGQWMCCETGLLARMRPQATAATFGFATFPDALTAQPDGSLAGAGVTVTRKANGLGMVRSADNLSTVLEPLEPATPKSDGLGGRYVSDELDAEMVIETRDGGVYVYFKGFLGVGIMERAHPVGADTWVVATRRSMDAPAPGDWTMSVKRGASGGVEGLVLGCWLARNIAYRKVS